MSTALFIRNQQRTFPINVRYLRWLTREVLQELLFIDDYDLAIYIVRAPKMARINRAYLQHEGSTDVITFDYGEKGLNPGAPLPMADDSLKLHGELFICIDDAVAQAREFRTTWQSEVVRYLIHGILHLCGYDDLQPGPRRVMKRQEAKLLKKIAVVFPLSKVALKPKLRP